MRYTFLSAFVFFSHSVSADQNSTLLPWQPTIWLVKNSNVWQILQRFWHNGEGGWHSTAPVKNSPRPSLLSWLWKSAVKCITSFKTTFMVIGDKLSAPTKDFFDMTILMAQAKLTTISCVAMATKLGIKCRSNLGGNIDSMNVFWFCLRSESRSVSFCHCRTTCRFIIALNTFMFYARFGCYC